MYEFLNDNSIYVVLVVALVNLFGFFIYLIKTERKLNKIEKNISLYNQNKEVK